MFHWICPECGREIAPTVRECPVCDSGAEQAELVLAGVVEASARTVEMEAPARALNVEASTRVRTVEAPPPTLPADAPARSTQVEESTGGNARVDGGTAERPVTRAGDGLPRPVKWSRTNGQTAPVIPALIPEILNAKSALDRAAEAKAADILGSAARNGKTGENTGENTDASAKARLNPVSAPEAKAVPAKTVESRAVETKPVDTKPVETRAIETKALGAKTVDSRAVDSKPVADGRPHEVRRQEVPPQDAHPQVVTPAIDRLPLLAKLSRLALPKVASPGKSGVSNTAIGNTAIGNTAPSDPARPSETGTETKADAKAGADAKPAAKPEGSGASNLREKTQAGLEQAEPERKSPERKATGTPDVTPEAVRQEPLLPSFTPPLESLDSLVAAAGMLDEPDPPVSGKLPLPVHPARLTPVPPSVVSIGAVSPRLTPPADKVGVRNLPPHTIPHEQKIAGLPLVESRFPLARPPVQTFQGAPPAKPVNVPPRAGAVRAPRSSAPFLGPRMAGLAKYSPFETRPITPVPPTQELRKSQTAPRITLPGPMLTRSLVSFQDRGLTAIFLEQRAFRKRFTYGWLAIILLVGTVLGVGFSNAFSVPRPAVETKQIADSKTASAAEPATSIDASVAPVRAAGSSPLSKAIEVTGFRIVMDPTRKAQIQYLVVNHSPTRFSDATIYVTLRTADARVGQPPLCRFSFAAPKLGPFEVKEMISAIEKTNRAVNLPEWQDLRAEVEIGQ